jgi:hypothetical protein
MRKKPILLGFAHDKNPHQALRRAHTATSSNAQITVGQLPQRTYGVDPV